MKRFILVLSLLFNVTVVHSKSDDHIVVITNRDSSVEKLNKAQLRNIFMGNVSVENIVPVALTPGEIARSVFNVRVIGLTESRIQAYWAQMKFSGRLERPDTAESIDELIIQIRSSDNVIGYVLEGTPLPEDVKVIYRSSEQ